MRSKILSIFLLTTLSSILLSQVVLAQRPQIPSQDTVFFLVGGRAQIIGEGWRPQGDDHNFVGVLIVPEPIEKEVVEAAWSYAIRYGADGLDLPNYERSIELLIERHPTWQAYITYGNAIHYRAELANQDTQDPTLTPTIQSTP